MAQNRGAGRPEKPYRKKFGYRVVVLFPREEKAVIKDACERSGKTMSEWLRDLARQAASGAA